MKKKLPFVLSFTLAAFIVVGQVGFAHGSDDDKRAGHMMNGNGMTDMMEEGSMTKMMQSCTNFMQSFGDDQSKE